MTGWIRLYRDIQKHWIWENDRYLRWWIVILLNVNHKPSTFPVSFELHTCNPGQSFMSLERWSELFGCSKVTTLKFFSMLESDQMISREILGNGNRRKHLLTVQNWEIYQGNATENCTETVLKTKPKQYPNNNDKNDKNENKREYVVEIVDYLNHKTGKSFRSTTKKTQALISARLNEGFSVEDFRKVIDTKTKQWKFDPDREEYLRPETLFGTKFESYLNQRKINDQPTRSPISSPQSIYAND